MNYIKKDDTIIVNNSNEVKVNLREIFEKYFYYWKWYILSFIIFLGLGYFYLIYTPKSYAVSTTIFIDDQEKGGLSTEMSAFQDLGVLSSGPKTSIINETGVLKSRTLIENVIKELDLNITFFETNSLNNRELYKDQVPINIKFFVPDSIMYNLDTTFVIKANSNSKFTLTSADGDFVTSSEFGKNTTSSFGEFNITPKNLNEIENMGELVVKIQPLWQVVNHYRQSISVESESLKSSLLIISLVDHVKLKAIDILNNMVVRYNKDAIQYKNLITNNTDSFINDRIEDVSKDLANVDKGVEDFKTENELTDIAYESNLILESSSELESRIVDLSSQLKLINYLQNYIKNNKNSLIPENLGLSDNNAVQSTLAYNQLLLERNRILKSSSERNPTVVNLDAQLLNLRTNIIQGLSNYESSLKFSLSEAQGQKNSISYRRGQAPKQEREFQDIKRQQQIIETLYLYLLQKREENAISLGMPVPNAKLIDAANGSDIPVAPQKIIIMIISFLLGGIVPTIIISIKSLMDNKIHSQEDVNRIIQAPLLGDIPHSVAKLKKVVSNNDRDGFAEAFRILRTNLSFMLNNVQNKSNIIMLTSTISGEGKTFITTNLCSVLAVTDKKVLLIGSDLRRPRLRDYLKINSEKGLSNFLADSSISISDIVTHSSVGNFDVIESGDIPPNPSELLLNGRFEKVIDYGKENYDYIIVDTAPVQLVTDTLLISQYADLFIYIIRANYLDKRLLNIPKKLYENNRFPNMALLLNDTDYKRGGYGYGYGYGYGK